MSGVGTIPAGWYADPSVPGQQRYWDGATWTEHTASGAPMSVSPMAVTSARPFVADVARRDHRAAWAFAGALAAAAMVVLAAIAVPAFRSQQGQAQAAALQSDLRNTALEFEAFYTSQGEYPTSLAEFARQTTTADTFNVYTTADGQAYCLEASDGDAWWGYDSRAMGVREGRC